MRNPNYWEYDSSGNRLPLLDEVKFTLIKDDKTLLQSFLQSNEDEDFTIPTESFQRSYLRRSNSHLNMQNILCSMFLL